MWVIHFGILVCNRQPMHAWFGIFINQEPQLPSLLPDLAHSCICFLWFVLVTYSNWNLTFLLCTSLGKLYNAVQKLWGQATFYLVVSLSPKFLNCIVCSFFNPFICWSLCLRLSIVFGVSRNRPIHWTIYWVDI